MNGISVFFSCQFHPQQCFPLNLRNHKTKTKTNQRTSWKFKTLFWTIFSPPTYFLCLLFLRCDSTTSTVKVLQTWAEKPPSPRSSMPSTPRFLFFPPLLYHNVLMVCFVSCEASNIFSLPFCCVLYSVCFCCEWMQILEGLVKLPDNRECADCRTKYFPFSQPIVLC